MRRAPPRETATGRAGTRSTFRPARLPSSSPGTLFDAAAADPRFYWMPAIAVSGPGARRPRRERRRSHRARSGGRHGTPGLGDPPASFSRRSRTRRPRPPTTRREIRGRPAAGATTRSRASTRGRHDDVDDPGVLQRRRLVGRAGGRRCWRRLRRTPQSPQPSSVAVGLASVLVDITGTLGRRLLRSGARVFRSASRRRSAAASWSTA